MTLEIIRIAIVGAGPRGTIALERICASSPEIAADASIEVHIIDPEVFGAGRVWRTGQNKLLLMNTVASDVTVFTDPTVQCEGPLVAGPSQYEWASLVASGEIPASGEVRAEAARMKPWSYATRAFQGHYLSWAFEHIVASAPANVSVHRHGERAVSLDSLEDGQQALRLSDRAEPLVVDSVILAQGHYDVAPTPAQLAATAFAEKHNLIYVPPISPAEADLSTIAAGELVVLRGMGLNFYDYTTLLTVGRGGKFEEVGDRLLYRPSGAEPKILAGSKRGVPYLARAEIRVSSVPRYQPRFLDAKEVSRFRLKAGTGTLDFKADVWPLVAKEVGWVYYRHLLRAGDPASLADFEARYAALEWGSPEIDDLIGQACLARFEMWDWAKVDNPAFGLRFADRSKFDQWIARRIAEDYADSTLGPDGSARKAVAFIMRDLRDEVRQVISFQGLRGASYRAHIDEWFSGLNNFIASGPPSSRVRELGALLDAGVISFVGPDMRIETNPEAGRFAIQSPAVEDAPLLVSCLVEAHLPPSDVRLATDPLLVHLREAGLCRPHVIPDADGSGYETGGIDVQEGTFRIIGRDGEPNRNLYTYGPPVEAVQWVTAIGARPNVNSRTLLQADSIARSALRAGCVKRTLGPIAEAEMLAIHRHRYLASSPQSSASAIPQV
ncbi:FAD/NAD(P)-binding protein [Agrobacterium rosae]|uniref:FAD-dependent urate hydroxylase HpyO/Asp monooxygenase CreE-like FAD/NAD(P)-binding domain-containing protein n=1 Tax=Agrobacterium rosae TaxID=1972867 RepID=A0A1R3U7V4_9HYPH|nr:FAD/NAD(P)-binding domain-containing protein [Agrobacterium rosae]SCX35904.1 hypothetical protein DSM25559_5209 [Agrobacterium rosae]